MLVTTFCAVAAAAISYYVRFQEKPEARAEDKIGYWGSMVAAIFLVAGPVVIMMLVSLFTAAMKMLNRPAKKRKRPRPASEDAR